MANASENEFGKKLDELAARIARIEEKLGIDAPKLSATSFPERLERKAEVLRGMERSRPEGAPAAPAAPPQPPAPPPPTAPPVTPPPVVASPRSSPPAQAHADLREAIAALHAPGASQTPARREVPATAPPVAPPVVKPRRSIEMAIGVNWLAWVGAIVILLAAAVFITTAYREGWLMALSPTTRCLSVAIFGVLLIAAGEWALRKVSRPAAVGFYGAGLGTLYLDAFATSQWFGIATDNVAFILLAIVALGGFALTLRARTLTIGILSVIGGYLAPILLADLAPNAPGSAAYLTVLLAIALGLSAFAPKPMRPLRYVAAGAHGFVAVLWSADAIPSYWLLAVIAFTLWWVMFVGEAVFAALRQQSTRGNVVITLLASAWYVLIGCAILDRAPGVGFDWLGAYTFAVAALCGAIAMQFGPGLNILRAKPRTAIDRLALSLMLQAGALLTVAVALQFDGMARSIAWLAIGVASIELGRRLPSRGMDVFGLIVGALGAGAVVLIESWTSPVLRNVVAELPGITITGWTMLALIAIAATLVAGIRLRPSETGIWNGLKVTLTALATLGWLLLWMSEAQDLATTWLWLVATVTLIALERFGRRERFFEIGTAALTATGVRWLLVDAVAARLSPHWEASDMLPIVNWQMALAAAIAVAALFAAWVARVRRNVMPAQAGIHTSTTIQSADVDSRSPSRVAAGDLHGSDGRGRRAASAIVIATIGFAAFMLFALSFEVDRIVTRAAAGAHSWSLVQMRSMMLTALWAAGSVAVHVFAYSLRRHGGSSGRAAGIIMRIAWVAMILLTGKWMILDTLVLGIVKPATARFDMLPMVNVQLLTAIVVAGGLVIMVSLMRRALAGGLNVEAAEPGHELETLGSEFERVIASFAPLLAGVFVLWALSFEVERLIGRLEQSGVVFNWPREQSRALAITMLWSVGSAVLALIGRWRRSPSLITGSAFVAMLTGVVWLSFDTLHFRLQAPPICTTPVANMQFIAGVLAACAIVLTLRLVKRSSASDAAKIALASVSWIVVAAIALWLGSLEIDRMFVSAAAALSTEQATARQMCLSVYWSIFAFVLVAAGFRIPSAAARYAGLGLFGLTLLKVLVVDLSQVENIYRVLSLLAVGLLLVLTSVAYAKLAPRLLGNERGSP